MAVGTTSPPKPIRDERHSTTTTESYSQQWKMVRLIVCVCLRGEVAILSMTHPQEKANIDKTTRYLRAPFSLPQSWRYIPQCKLLSPPLQVTVVLPLQGCTNEKIQQPKKRYTTLNMACDTTRCYFFSVLFFSFPSHSRFSFNTLANKTDKNYYILPSGTYNIQTLSWSVDMAVFGQRKEDQIGYQYVPEATKSRFVIIIF